MTHDPTAEWRIEASAYPESGTAAEQLRFLVGYAILAPSGHNTQPWLFRIGEDYLDVLADRTRALPAVDPYDRALVISCGAALGLLRIATRRFGHESDIEVLPDGSDPDLLARVRLGAARVPTAADCALFDAIPKRRSTRARFRDEPLPPMLAHDLVAIAQEDGVELVVITEHDRKTAVAALVAEGDRAQFADSGFRRELASWVHSRRAASRDGMSGANFGMPDVFSRIGGLVIRTFDMGNAIAAKDEEIALNSPALIVAATRGDDQQDWLAVGMGHVTALLAVTAAGLTASYLNQPIEVDGLRSKLREAVGAAGFPQLLFRIGHGPEIEPAVRRPVQEVVVKA